MAFFNLNQTFCGCLRGSTINLFSPPSISWLILTSSTIDKKLENFEFIFEFKIAINFEFNFEIFKNFEFNFENFVNFEFIFKFFLSISSFLSVADEVTITTIHRHITFDVSIFGTQENEGILGKTKLDSV